MSTIKLAKPAGWKPDPTTASLRFASIQKEQVKVSTSSVAASDAGLMDGESSSNVTPDFDGLNQLLQEDLLAAAGNTASVVEKFAGPNSYLSKMVATLTSGDAPAPVSHHCMALGMGAWALVDPADVCKALLLWLILLHGRQTLRDSTNIL